MIKLLTEVCSIPTAPFAEQYVVRYVEDFVAARRGLMLSRDEAGNLLLELRGKSRGRGPRWVFAAHMDHPGFVARRMVDAKTLEADFRGWVHIDYVRGTRVRFFEADGSEVPGVVTEVTGTRHDNLQVPARVRVKVSRTVSKGVPGMFDLGAGRIRGKKFWSRGVDDQGGMASALAMLDAFLAKPAASAAGVAVLLTRAEEEAFIGAIAAVLKPKLLRKSDRIIAIECSAEQPYARQGDGVIIRVGDKTSIFNSSLTYFLTRQAEALAKKDKSFKFQRALMPGGTCEATVYDAWGYTAAAVCVPLGNYHNMDRSKKRIAAEYIDVRDWTNMVKLFVQLARNGDAFSGENVELKQRVVKRFQKLKKYLGAKNPGIAVPRL
jgi:endoglucanase